MLRDVRDHPRRVLGRPRRTVGVAVIAILAVATGGCGGGSPSEERAASSTSGSARLSSPATVEIVRPTTRAVVASPVTVEVRVDGGEIVGPEHVGAVAGDRGHIHLTLDGVEVAQMFYDETFDLGALEPGTHTLQAEFVATDHQPFANRPLASVVFRVG